MALRSRASHAALVGAVDHHAQRVVARVDEVPRVLVRAPEDDVVPAVVADGRVRAVLNVRAPELAGLRVG